MIRYEMIGGNLQRNAFFARKDKLRRNSNDWTRMHTDENCGGKRKGKKGKLREEEK